MGALLFPPNLTPNCAPNLKRTVLIKLKTVRLTHFPFLSLTWAQNTFTLSFLLTWAQKSLVHEQLTVHSLPPFLIYSKRR